MKQRLTTIVLCLLLNVFSYSQNVLIDNNGDTLVAITIHQMDKIYIELIQKDSLMEQAILSSSKEVKLYELIRVKETNLKSCESVLQYVKDSNDYLLSDNKKKDKKIKRTRNIAVCSIIIGLISILL